MSVAEYQCGACGGWHDIPREPERGNTVACIAALRADLARLRAAIVEYAECVNAPATDWVRMHRAESALLRIAGEVK